MAHALGKLESNEESTLVQAQQQVAEGFGFGSWLEVVHFSRDCAVLLDVNTVRYKRRLRIDKEHAWKWLVTPELLAKWHIPTEMDFRVGGSFEFKNAWNGVIGEIDEGSRIRFDADEGGYSVFSLVEKAEGVFFELIDYMAPNLVVPSHVRTDGDSAENHQPGGPGTHWRGVLAGWHYGSNVLRNSVVGTTYAAEFAKLEGIYSRLLRSFHLDQQ